MPIDRLSARGQEAMNHAAVMAKQLGSPTINSEHILLGAAMIAGPGRDGLHSLDLNHDGLLDVATRQLCARHLGALDRDPVLHAEAKRIIDHAWIEACDDDCPQIDTNHLVRAIARNPNNTAMCLVGYLLQLQPRQVEQTVREAIPRSQTGVLA